MDIDIDFKPDFNPLDFFKDGIRASQVEKDGTLRKHNAGVYFQSIPKDPLTNLAAIPFKEAEKMGYFKIDFLHIYLLEYFKSKEEIRQLMEIEPDWSLLDDPKVVEKLFQLGRHYDVIQTIQPRSVEDLCDCVAIIRPGKKRFLRYYRENKEVIREELYKVHEGDKYTFKRSHALAYAFNVVLNLHLIKAGIL